MLTGKVIYIYIKALFLLSLVKAAPFANYTEP